MWELTRQEKIILLFLTASFITGLGVRAYKSSQQGLTLTTQPYQLEQAPQAVREQADRFIARQRFININSFEIDELTHLPGVGEKLAARIVEYHKSRGSFRSKEELMQVKGIGEKKFEQLKDLIKLDDYTD